MELDCKWKYKHGSTKPPIICPYCGSKSTEVDYDGDFACYCPRCDSEWTETKETWHSVQASGYIQK